MTASLWKLDRSIILASTSATRLKLLSAVGIPCRTVAPAVDERALAKPLENAGAGPDSIALELARAKCLAVSNLHQDDLVLGADQTLALGNQSFSKPASRSEAAEHLRQLSGRSHELHSAAAVARGGQILFEVTDTAQLTMRLLSDDFIETYLDVAGEQVRSSVGAYQVEGLGLHLFDRVDGDHATILGLPLLALLGYFRLKGMLAA